MTEDETATIGFAAFEDGTFEISLEKGCNSLFLSGQISKEQIAISYDIVPMCVYENVKIRDSLLSANRELVEALQETVTAWRAAKLGDIAAANWMNAAEERAIKALSRARSSEHQQ